MSDTKQNRLPERVAAGYEEQLSRVNGQAGVDTPLAGRRSKGLAAGSGRDVSSWDAYRNWLTKVQAPEQRRSLPEAALFSWKGYRSWAEKVRRDWNSEDES